MKEKLKKCKEWGVQIADCRYRPLDQLVDAYNPLKNNQTNNDYYIDPRWTDKQVKLFRKKVRQQNITIRHGFKYYDLELERLGRKKEEK